MDKNKLEFRMNPSGYVKRWYPRFEGYSQNMLSKIGSHCHCPICMKEFIKSDKDQAFL